MIKDTGVSLSILVAVIMGELLHYCIADSQTGGIQQHDYDYYNHYNSYDTEMQPPVEPIDYGDRYSTIQCYTCTYMVKEGHTSGVEKCRDPFDRSDMTTLTCKGACAKIYHQHGENDFFINRACLPNCKEHRDDKSYTQCCVDSYCNRASLPHHSYHLGLWISSVLLTVYLAVTR